MYAVVVTGSTHATPVVRTMPSHYNYKQAKRAMTAYAEKCVKEYRAMGATDVNLLDLHHGYLIQSVSQDRDQSKSVEIRLARLMGEIRDPADD